MSRAWFTGLVAAAAVGWGGPAVAGPQAPAAGGPDGAPAQAADPQGPFVVLVGVGRFQDQAIEPRPTAEADARAIADLLSDPRYLNVSPDRVIVLTAAPDPARKERPATRDNIVAALAEAAAKTGRDDTVIVGLFGRGASAGDKTCFFTADTRFKDRAKTGLLGADMKPAFRAARDRKLCVLLDVAFKGFDAGAEKLAEPGLRDVFAAVFGTSEDDKDEEQQTANKLVVLAATPSHAPLTKGPGGLFAAVALDALRGKADAEGYEPDGLVTVDEFVKYLEKEAADEARKLGKTPQEKEAVPFIVGEETSHFPLTTNPAAKGKVDERVKALDALAKAGKVPAEAAEEGRKLLSRMPKLKTPQELRRQYQALADGALAADAFAAERARLKVAMTLPAADADRFVTTVRKAIGVVRPKYVKEIPAGEWAAMAVRGLYRRLEEPLPADVREAVKNLKDADADAAWLVLQDARVRLGRREDLDGDKGADLAISAMMGSLSLDHKDPYSAYYDKDLIKKMDAPLRGEFRGVGVQIRRDLVRDGLLVVTPIKGSPAYAAGDGIKAGDLIVEIRRETDAQGNPLAADAPKVISTKGMKTEQALEIILGRVGVPITLVVERDGPDGKPERKEFTIRRGKVVMESVLGVKRDDKDDWDYFIDPDNKIGYVSLTQFSPTTAQDLYATVQRMQRAGLKGLVLDLRFNPGGLLTQAVAVSDLFLDDGLIVSVRYRYRGQEERTYDRNLAAFTNFPMVVLVNGASASASEIVSAALRDHGRAKVAGERTYGKGSVQNVEDFDPTGGQFKLTTARYFPPKGENIDKLSTAGKDDEAWGVRPDPGLEVKLSRDQMAELAEHFREREVIPNRQAPAKEPKAFKDTQLEKAVEFLRGQVQAARR